MFAASKSGQFAATATDPYFPYVPLLLETTSTNGQTNNTFLDSSTNNFTITRNGTPTQGSVTPYWPNGYWSTNLNGSTDTLTTVSGAMSYAGDFSIECWFNTTTTTTYACLYSDETGSTGGTILLNNGANNGQIVVFIGTAVSTFTSTSTGLNNGTWNHVALTRSGSTVRLFINGALQNTTTASGTITTTSTVRIGSSFFASRFFGGYISNFRIVVGSAVYTSAFTPSTTPLTAITNTSLLTCQSNRFIDNSSNNRTITVVSTPKVQAFQPFSPPASYTTAAYGGSGYFNGSSDYLTSATTAALDLTSGDWTIQGWYYPTAYSASNNVIVYIGSAAGNKIVLATIGTAGNLYYLLNGSVTISSATAAPLNAWSFYALVKSGATTTLYLNGVSLGTTASVPTTSNKSLSLGADTAAAFYQGYFGDFRVLKGTALTTVPTTPLTAITNTSLLLNFTNAGIYDAAVQNNEITVGSAQASTTITAKWPPTSMKFNGTTDYLTAPASPGFAFGTGNFTVEAWVYPTARIGSGNFGSQIAGCQVYGVSADWVFCLTATGLLYFQITSSTTGAYVSTTAVPLNAWTHVAISRTSGTVRAFVNGTDAGNSGTYATAITNASTPFSVGGASNGSANSLLQGYLQDVRITKGFARYTANFSVPTAAFPTR